MNKIEILTCHCKKVHIELKLENGLEELVRCNCSLCKRRGYIMAKIKLENLKIIKGNDQFLVYKFGKKHLAEHFFCKNCGIYTLTDHILTQKIMNIMSPVSTILILLNIRIFQFLMEKNYKIYEYFGKKFRLRS